MFEKLANMLGKSVDELKREFEEDYSKAWIHKDEQFRNLDDNIKRQYWLRVFFAKKSMIYRYNEKSFKILPIGYSSLRKTKDERDFRIVYAIVDKKIKKILFFDDLVDRVRDVNLFSLYDVFLQEGKDVLFATENTVFRNPIKTYDGNKVIRSVAKKATLAEIDSCISRLSTSGFTDDTDLYYIQGIITRVFDGERDDGSEVHIIELSDGTITEERVSNNGVIISPVITCFLPEKSEYDVTSEVIVCGSISLSDSQPIMNAIALVPQLPFVKRR